MSNFNSVILSVLDQHAPKITRVVTVRPCRPWFTEAVRKLKQQKRRAERRWRRTKLASDYERFKTCKNSFTNHLKLSKQQHFLDLVQEKESDPKALFQICKSLMKQDQPSPLPESHSDVELTNDFSSFFTKKIQDIRRKLVKV